MAGERGRPCCRPSQMSRRTQGAVATSHGGEGPRLGTGSGLTPGAGCSSRPHGADEAEPTVAPGQAALTCPRSAAHQLLLSAVARDRGGCRARPLPDGASVQGGSVSGKRAGSPGTDKVTAGGETAQSSPIPPPPAPPPGRAFAVCSPGPTIHPLPRPPPPACTTGPPGWPAVARLSDGRAGGGRGRCPFSASAPHGSSPSALRPLPPSQPSSGLCLCSSLQLTPPSCAAATWDLGNVLFVHGNRASRWVTWSLALSGREDGGLPALTRGHAPCSSSAAAAQKCDGLTGPFDFSREARNVPLRVDSPVLERR